jgi:hypothetical protein
MTNVVAVTDAVEYVPHCNLSSPNLVPLLWKPSISNAYLYTADGNAGIADTAFVII